MLSIWQALKNGRILSLGDLSAVVKNAREQNDPPSESFERWLGDYPPVKPGDLSRLKHPSFIRSQNHLNQLDRADWQQTDPRLRLFAGAFQLRLIKLDVPFFVHSAFRTREEQNALVAKGASKTPWPRASHCQGKAFDLVHSRYAWDLSRAEWDTIGVMGKQLAKRLSDALPARDKFTVTWGGDWSFYDPAHWELSDWKQSIKNTSSLEPVRYTPTGLVKRSGLT